jgi:queuine/archaeosine tRNA-ribosyltransferase
MMEEIRDAIEANKFVEYKKAKLEGFKENDCK